MSVSLLLGALCVFLLISAVGVCAGRRIKSAADFAVGRGMSVSVVAGSLVGTLVGGASTVGTAQLAFTNGLSAWWYTLGGGIGHCFMAAFFAGPLRKNKSATLPQILTKEYGSKTATVAAVLMSVGTFISIVSQMISGTALVTAVISMPTLAAAGLTAALMVVYVLFGGAWGAGLVGRVKTALLYGLTMLCAVLVLYHSGLKELFSLPQKQYFNLFSRGLVIDGGAGLSLVFGVLTTQAYFLPIISAKDKRTAGMGSLVGGALTVIIGMAGVLVGLFMRLRMPETASVSVLPVFVMTYLPDFAAGIVLATLLVTLVGTGAGLALGISTMLTMDRKRAAACLKNNIGGDSAAGGSSCNRRGRVFDFTMEFSVHGSARRRCVYAGGVCIVFPGKTSGVLCCCVYCRSTYGIPAELLPDRWH